ncbi:MAG: hypothetical protein KDC38_14235, partial [Planctomycetes bacterium]|nr:hypothetical protein [Planctomycetota bacterium]
AVAIDGDLVVAGAPRYDTQVGRVSAFRVFGSDCDEDLVCDSVEIATGLEADCNGNDVPDSCELVSGSSPDCNFNDVPDECDIASGTSLDIDSNGIPDECLEPSCSFVRLDPTELGNDSRAGWDVAVSGDYGFVSTPWISTDDPAPGSVCVFHYDGTSWTEVAVLEASDAADQDQFGWALAAHDDLLVVGARRAGPSTSGSVYVFRFDGNSWIEEQKLVPAFPYPQGAFGYSVDVRGDLIIVGAAGEAGFTGASYIFRHDGSAWVQEQKLQPFDTTDSVGFGASVAIDETRALCGADSGGIGSVPTGTVYAYETDGTGWSFTEKLSPPVGVAQIRFGAGIALDGDRLVVGAPQAYSMAVHAGEVFLFEYLSGGWQEASSLTASDPTSSSYFGYQVDLEGDTIVSGAPGAEESGVEGGAIYVLRRDGDHYVEQKLVALVPRYGARFGTAVSIAGGHVWVGAPGDDVGCLPGADCDRGTAYALEVGEGFIRGDCNNDGTFEIADSIYELDWLFGSGDEPDCDDACDINDDGAIDIGDPLYSLNYLFDGGPAPPSPFPMNSIDRTSDGLDCAAYVICP